MNPLPLFASASSFFRRSARRLARSAAGLALLGAALGLPAARAQIYVANNNGAGSVSVFAQGANGNALSDMELIGATTGINTVVGVTANTSNLYVLCNNFIDPPFVLKYSLPTAGNAAPLTKTFLAPSAGTFDSVVALALDGTNIYVLDNGSGAAGANGAVSVYPLGNLTGNTGGSPLAAARTITGAATLLNRPNGLAVDGTSIYVANTLGNNLLVFALAATGDVAPAKSITGLSGPQAVAVDATTIYVLNVTSGRVTTYPVGTAGGAVAATTTIGSTVITTGATYLGVDATHVYLGDSGDVLDPATVPSVFAFPKATNNTGATPSTTIAGTTALPGINSLFVLAPPGTAAPTLTASGGSTAFTAGGGAVTVESALTLTAVPATLATGTVQITGGFQTAQDVLTFTNNNAATFGNIAGTYNATLGLIRLESIGATATKAQWQAALRAVAYNNTSGAPNTADRTLGFKVFDGAQTSTNATKTVTVSAAPTAPGAPTIGTATAGNAQATVTFTAPGSNGGSAITGYTVTSSPAGGIDSNAGSTALSHVITGLTNGTAYTFTVTATNAAGTGPGSLASNSVTPFTVPGAPTIGTATAGNAQATVTFTAPFSNGGSAITGYTVTSSPGGGTDSNAGSTGLSHVITGLTNGTAYTFTVRATNAAGPGSASGASNSVTPATVPGAPTTVTATAGNTQATVTFTAPSNGGSAITGYTVTSNPAGGTDSNAGSTALSHVITGLTNGTAYTFTVTATNAVGTGSASAASNSVSPVGAPTIASVTTPPATTYVAGQNLDLTVTFTSAVTVTGTPRLGLVIGSTARNASYVSGSGTTALTFRYPVVLGDNDTDGITVASPVALNGGTIGATGGGLAATLTFAAPNTTTVLVATKAVLVASGGTTAFTSADNAAATPVNVDSAITLTDASLSALPSSGNVFVTISANYQAGADVLSFANTSAATFGDITSFFVTTTGFLPAGTLVMNSPAGTATIAQWQAALRAVKFTSTSSNPSTANRTISIYLNDGTQDSNTVTKTVSVTAVNQTPVVATTGGSASATGSGSAVAVDSAITVTDGNSATLASGTVAITGNFQTAEDVLAFTNSGATTFGNIAASYNAATGVLALTSAGATATVAQWQAALRAVTYRDTAITANTATRTIGFAVNDGTVSSATATRAVTVALPIPTIASVGAPAGGTYIAGQTLTFTVVFDQAVTVTGTPRLNVTIGSNVRTANYVSGSGTATLTFGYTVVVGDNAASGIAVSSPLALNSGTIKAGANNAALTFTPPTTTAILVSTAPILTASSGNTAFASADNAAATPVVVDGAITLTDPSLAALPANGGAIVTISANYQSGTDVLSFTNTSATTYGDIAAQFFATSFLSVPAGSLALSSGSGTATIAQWQAALRAVKFTSTAVVPATANRTVSFTVNDGVQTSNTVTKTVTVTATNQSPLLATTAGATTYPGGGTAIAVDPGLTVSDLDSTTLNSALITITGFQSGTEFVALTANATAMGNITPSYATLNGVATLVLTSAGSTATLAQWQAALRAVTYFANASFAPVDRTINFQASDGISAGPVVTKTVAVRRAPVIAWTPAAATAGATLGSGQLNAIATFNGATVAGTFVYSPASGTALSLGTQTLSATFTPADTATFAPATATASLTVNLAPTTVVAATATASYTGASQTLSLSATVTSTGGTVNTGTVTFTIVDAKGATIGTAVTSGTVANGTATASYTLPASAAAASYSIQAVYNAAGTFATGSATAGSFALAGANTTTTATFGEKTTVADSGIRLPGRSKFIIWGMAVSPTGTLYFTDSEDFKIYKVNVDRSVSTPPFVGISRDEAVSISFDAAGNLYYSNVISFRGQETISEIGRATPSNISTRLVSVTHQNDYRLLSACDAEGNVYFGNLSGDTIRKISTSGTVSTFATGMASILGLAVDPSGNVYVSSQANGSVSLRGNGPSLVRKITPGGTVSTIATLANLYLAIAVDASGNVYVGRDRDDAGLPAAVLKIEPNGQISTYASAGLLLPSTMVFDASGTLYVNDYGDFTIKTIAKPNSAGFTLSAAVTSTVSTTGKVGTGTVTFTVTDKNGQTVGTAVTSGTVTDGTASADFSLPANSSPGDYTVKAVYNAAGNFSTSTGTTTLKITAPPTPTTTVASGKFVAKPKYSAFTKIVGRVAPMSIAFDSSGNLYTTDVQSGGDTRLVKVTPAGVQSPLSQLSSDGQTNYLTVDPSGNIYVANWGDGTLVKITAGGAKTTLAINLPPPESIAVDSSGNIFLVCKGDLIKITPTLAASTLATVGSIGRGNSYVAIPHLGNGMVVDKTGNLYVATGPSGKILKVTPGGAVSTFASGFKDASGLAIDASGVLYLSESPISLGYSDSQIDSRIWKITADGTVSLHLDTLAAGYFVQCIALDKVGNLFFSGIGDNLSLSTITKVTFINTVELTAKVTSTSGTVDTGTVTFTLTDSDGKSVGSAVTSGKVSGGTTTVTYPIPAGVSNPPYTINAVYNAGGTFAASSDRTQKLSPTIAQAFQILFGGFSSPAGAASIKGESGRSARAATTAGPSTLAAVLNPNGTTGKLVGYLAGINAGFAVDLAINDDDTFTGQTQALTSSTGTGRTLTFSGRIASGVMTGTVAELGLTFTANVDAAAGSSQASAGLYKATAANGTTTYSVIGTQGQVFALALTSTGVAAGTGTVSATGAYTVATAQGTTIAGAVNAGTGVTTATLTLVDGSTIGVTGLSSAVVPTSRFSNLSVRAAVGGGQTITQGFVISGPKTLLARAIGPGLAQFGVPGVLQTPSLALFDDKSRLILSNSGWAGDSTLAAAFSQVGAFALAPTSRDAAAIADLPAGAYTLQVTGGVGAGQALAELYDLGASRTSPLGIGNLINLSTLGQASGSTVLVAGLVVDGNTPRRVIIRGIGPSLGQFGVSTPLATPLLRLYDGTQTLIAQNQAWGTPVTITAAQPGATASQVAAAALAAGAFPLAAGSVDSSLVVTLAPGSYTVHLTGANNASGTGLIEIYEVK